ncbi:MAG: tRNA (adenosine(37)-N6)-threonylcarbamoyltransferase complex transferase subunit TsaD [Rickettsiales bacterium]|nr:tRNA (adenosine(37)-N6)-threonylcarbamoyltransferase complex transferase subunit TsaD [Rickettsiales bacterium]
MMKVLGIETSCDETAVAIVDGEKNILSHVLNSQIDLHEEYGGVVPEVAARAHVEILDGLILESLKKAKLTLNDIDAFAVTAGPGLIGGVIVGLMAVKTLASVYKKPFIAVNHLEAHALTVRLTSEVEFPYLLLLVSGGHCQILLAMGVGDYKKIGETIDDALGEAFDKVAQMLGLPYPGGPQIEKIAALGDETRFKFSRPLIDGSNNKEHLFNFSFSGLKTAVRRQIEKLIGEEFSHFTSPQKINEKDRNDIAASFQKTVVEIILNRLENVLTYEKPNVQNLVIAGGVAANRYIFSHLTNWADNHNLKVITPPLNLCTDNAAMIAWVGVEKMKLEMFDDLNFKAKARWELSNN